MKIIFHVGIQSIYYLSDIPKKGPCGWEYLNWCIVWNIGCSSKKHPLHIVVEMLRGVLQNINSIWRPPKSVTLKALYCDHNYLRANPNKNHHRSEISLLITCLSLGLSLTYGSLKGGRYQIIKYGFVQHYSPCC